MPAKGYIGELAGMFFDPITGRYYPIPRGGTAQTQNHAGPSRPPTSQAGPSTPAVRPRRLPRKRQRNDVTNSVSVDAIVSEWDLRAGRGKEETARAPFCKFPPAKADYGSLGASLPSRPRGLRSRMVPSESALRRQIDSAEADMYSNLELEGAVLEVEGYVDSLGEPTNETIIDLTTFPTGAFYVTTTCGRLITVTPGDKPALHDVKLCRSPLLGVHHNLPRMSYLSISKGTVPHVQCMVLDPSQPERLNIFDDFILRVKDVFCYSSHGDSCTIGATKQLITLHDNSSSYCTELPSDPMAVHHTENDIVYAGLRNSHIHAADLRMKGADTTPIAKLTRGKAVVGIKRLKDSAVPYGLVASGMSNELLLFDVRYGDKPVFSLPGHVNTYLSELGLATTFDDNYLFAAGSDSRIRAWSLLTGTRLHPTTSDPLQLCRTSLNPLTKLFDAPPTNLAITENGSMDVACGKTVQRFSKPTVNKHYPMDVEMDGAEL